MLKSELSAVTPVARFDDPVPRARGSGNHAVIVEAEELGDRGDLDPIGGTEDLEREADGIPHQVVGFTALFSFVFAVLLVLLFMSGTAGRVSAVLLALIGLPILVTSLTNQAARKRDRRHPSR